MMDDDAIPLELDSAASPGAKVRIDASTVKRVIKSTPVGGRPTCFVYSEGGSGHVLGTTDEVQDLIDSAFEEAEAEPA